MAYKVLVDFKDLRDGGYQYKAGDDYPRAGVSVSRERIAMLSSPTPQRGALIGEVETVKVEQAEPVKEAEPVEVKPNKKKSKE